MEPTYHSGDDRFDLKPLGSLSIKLGVLCLDQAPGLCFPLAKENVTPGSKINVQQACPPDIPPRKGKLCSAFGLRMTIVMALSGAMHKYIGLLVFLETPQVLSSMINL